MAPGTPLWPSDLDARYELLEEAGRGGMGVVYKARDRETGELVAIKVLKPEIAADRASADRFINEVRLSRRITHKNVCRVYEFTRVGSTAYLSMEYVEGESLRSILSRLGSVNLRKGIQIARQICAALAEAHAQGIVHRDLKPENVMLDRSGNVKVMDFGIARLLDSGATATGGIMGTPAYMAPEQAESRPIDGRTDVYALGLVLYEIFTGQTAFTGDTPVAVALKQIRETPAAPRTIDTSLPPAIDAVVMRCLEKDPAQRFQSVEELDAALASIPLHTSTATTAEMTALSPWPPVAKPAATPMAPGPTPAPPPPHLPARRKLAVIAAAAAAAAAIAAAVYVTLLRTNDEIPFSSFKLQNGLQVLISEDHSAPTVSVVVTYAVGSRDEREGRRGFAHLFEHMMFSGSLNVGKGEHVALVAGYGGVANGSAQFDTTRFSQTLPSNQLDLLLFLEADRMRSLKLSEAQLEAERGTVLAEISQTKENQPYGRAQDALFARAFDTPGYKHDAYGSIDDIRGATLQEVADFFKIYFAPNNAVLTIVGDVSADEARAGVEKWFQHIPAQPPAPVPDLSEPPQTAERRVTLEDSFAPVPRLYIAYKAPAGASSDWDALSVLASVMGSGTSSRLAEKLVRDTRVSAGTGLMIDRRAGPGLATFVVTPAPNRDAAAVIAQFDAAIREVVERGISDVEMMRVKRRTELGRATSLQATRDRAATLGDLQSRYGDAASINRRAARLEAVTLEEVARVAREYLKPERRTILEIVPTPAKRAAAQPVTSATVAAPTERLNKGPVSKDVLQVSLPPVREFSLDNGLAVQIAETRRVPLVTLRFDIRGAGPMYDPVADPGLALMTAVMLRAGAAGRGGRELTEQLDLLGASVSAGTAGDPGSIHFTATGLPDTIERWLPIVADMVVKPSFPADDLTITKRSFASELATRRSTPAAAASDLMVTVITGAAMPIVASPSALERLSADRLAAWHRERYVPQNTVLSIVGDVDAEAAEKAVRAALSGWARTSFTDAPRPIGQPAQRTVHVMDRPASVQATLMMGNPGVARADADFPGLMIGHTILGSPQSGRLFRSLRESRGWSFNPASGLLTYKHGGLWLMYADVATARAGDALGVFVNEVQQLSSTKVTDAELEEAKRSIVGNFALSLESLASLATAIAGRRSEGLSTDYWERFPRVMQAVTADDIRRVAAKYMDPSKVQITAVGVREQLVPLLTPFGPVTFYDAEGRPLPRR